MYKIIYFFILIISLKFIYTRGILNNLKLYFKGGFYMHTKHKIFILLIFIPFLLVMLSNCYGNSKKFYVSTRGNDAIGNGSKSKPWKSIAFAAKKCAENPGSTLIIEEGTYIEDETIVVPPNINIEGAGPSKTIIKPGNGILTSIKAKTLFSARSQHHTPGNQYFKGFTLDGLDKKLRLGMEIIGRDNVVASNIEFINFKEIGLLAASGSNANSQTPPSYYIKGVKIFDCKFTNCARDIPGNTSGCLTIGGLEDSEIYNITINENEGYGIKFINAGWYKNVKIHDCDITVSEYDKEWQMDCAIELWHPLENTEVYNIKTNTWLSFVGSNPNPSDKKDLKVFNCHIVPNKNENDNEGIEINMSNVEVFNNYIEQVAQGIAIWERGGQNIDIHNNVIINRTLPPSNTIWEGGVIIVQTNSHNNSDTNNIHIHNNIIGNFFKGVYARVAEDNCVIRDLSIKNNIFLNCSEAAIKFDGIDNKIINVDIQNNLYHNCAKFIYEKSKVAGTLIQSGNIRREPIFNLSGDKPFPFYLPKSPESPQVDAGVDVGLRFKGKSPDIGAYEFEH